MITPRNQETVVSEIIDGLLHPSHPTCSQVVVPPGFDADELAEHVVGKLAIHVKRPAVAAISSNEVNRVEDFVWELHRQWSKSISLNPLDDSVVPVLRLKCLLEGLPEDRLFIQVLKRFDAILDSLDETVLAHLRLAEQRKRLRSVTLSPYPYDEVKRRWKRRGHILTTSDYGRAPLHAKHVLEPALEHDMTLCENTGLAQHVLEHAYALTGGLPRFLNELVGFAIRNNTRLTVPELRQAMHIKSVELLRELIDDLDGVGEMRFRDLVIKLHLGIDQQDARYVLAKHPASWGHVLLTDDAQELRAECLGPAALAVAADEAIFDPQDSASGSDALRRAVILYQQKQFEDAFHWAEKVPWGHRSDVKVLKAHADVMRRLYGVGMGVSGNDTDWVSVSWSVRQSKELVMGLPTCTLPLWVVEKRYAELEEIALSITMVTKSGQPRVVDCLAGLRGDVQWQNCRAALVFLQLMIESARAIRGNSSACQSVITLPEQIYRVWAFWKLGLNYYASCDSASPVWNDVADAWGTEFRRPEPGKSEFPSSEAFAYFALATLQRSETDTVNAPSPDFPSLKRDLGVCGIRRDAAHAAVVIRKKQRDQFFEVIDRWFVAMISACPVQLTKGQIEGIVSTLPLPTEMTDSIYL